MAGKADSMIILTMLLAIAGFGVMYVFFSGPINSAIVGFNDMVDAGTISEKTVSVMDKCVDLWKASPFFLVIGLAVFVFERSKGTDISYQTLFMYMFLMVAGILVSVVMVWVFGSLIDLVLSNIYGDETLSSYGEDWDSTNGFVKFALNILYLAAMAPGYLCSILYMFHPVIRQTETAVVQPVEQSYDGGFNLEQF